jgi:hypothetical protein
MIKSLKQRAAMIPMLGKIKLGDPKPQSGPGRNSDKFRFDLKIDLEKDADISLQEKFGDKITELKVLFPRIDKSDDDRSLAFIFDANYKMYRENKLWCVGDGEVARRREKDLESGREDFVERSCPCDFLSGDKPSCKMQGELKIAPIELLKEGIHGYFLITTTSWNAVKELHSVIQYYHELLEDAFWKTPFILSKKKVAGKTQDGKRFDQWVMTMRADPKFLKEHNLFDKLYSLDDDEALFDEEMPEDFYEDGGSFVESEIDSEAQEEKKPTRRRTRRTAVENPPEGAAVEGNDPDCTGEQETAEPVTSQPVAQEASPSLQPEQPTPVPPSADPPRFDEQPTGESPAGAEVIEESRSRQPIADSSPAPTVAEVPTGGKPVATAEVPAVPVTGSGAPAVSEVVLSGTTTQRVVARNRIVRLTKEAMALLPNAEPVSWLAEHYGLAVEIEAGVTWETSFIKMDIYPLELLKEAQEAIEATIAALK